jgi:hypothetical protein
MKVLINRYKFYNYTPYIFISYIKDYENNF